MGADEEGPGAGDEAVRATLDMVTAAPLGPAHACGLNVVASETSVVLPEVKYLMPRNTVVNVSDASATEFCNGVAPKPDHGMPPSVTVAPKPDHGMLPSVTVAPKPDHGAPLSVTDLNPQAEEGDGNNEQKHQRQEGCESEEKRSEV